MADAPVMAASMGSAESVQRLENAQSVQSAESDADSDGSNGSEEKAQALPAQPSAPGAPVAPRDGVMLDIQARVDVAVKDVRSAAAELRKMVVSRGGVVTRESLASGENGGEARLTVRVPAGDSNGVVTAIHTLGEVTVHEMTAEDVGKRFYDSQVALANLEVTLARYRAILERATTVQEVLVIEQHLARVRGEIERIKGELRFLRDRAAKATIHVTLRSTKAELARAAFYPGVRAAYLLDFRGEQGEDGYLGGGLSLRFSRALSVELDALRRFGSEERGIDGLLVTLGSDTYSQLAGGGARPFLNPYLGYRVGYARLPGKEDAFVVGGVAGVGLVQTRWVSLDADVTGLGFFGDRAVHFAVQPALTVNFAF